MLKILILISGMLAASAIGAAELKLLVQGRNLQGKEVRVALYSSAHSFPRKEDDARTAKAVTTGDGITFYFSNLPPGEYAVSAFADINGNARLDSNFLGIPTEPYGFSRDARGFMGPPGFTEAAFRVGNIDITQTFHLQ